MAGGNELGQVTSALSPELVPKSEPPLAIRGHSGVHGPPCSPTGGHLAEEMGTSSKGSQQHSLKQQTLEATEAQV